MDVIARYESLRAQRPELKLYVLVDGLAYEAHTGGRLYDQPGISRALFEGTPDQALAYAGPWLFAAAAVEDQWQALFAFEAQAPAVSWLIAPMDLEGLAQLLQLRMDLRLPEGKTALLRLSDPRVIDKLLPVFTPAQRLDFFGLIDEWHFMRNGQRVWTARTDA